MNLAIIQARMGSSRLPGKVAMDICGKSMLQRVIDRVNKCQLITTTIVATSTNSEDNIIAETIKDVDVYRGSNDDVLERYYRTVLHHFKGRSMPLDLNIIRITADCPLIDPDVIGTAIIKHCDQRETITVNLHDYPDGLDVEVFPYAGLMASMATKRRRRMAREHVTTWMLSNYNVNQMERDPGLAHLNWSVDVMEELEFSRKIYENLGDNFRLVDILRYTGEGE